MKLSQLVKLIEQHHIRLTLLEDGRVKPSAPAPIPGEILQAMKEHRAALVRRLQEGRTLDGRQNVTATAAKPGHCGSCARAKPAPEEWGAGMVVCTCDPVAWWPLSPPFAIHFAARCGAYQLPGEEVGSGWRAKSGGKTWGAFPSSPVEGVPGNLGGTV